MKKGKVFGDKRGGMTFFISIVLSAAIIVETLYIAVVVDYDRRLSVQRAMKLQVEQIMADYNRELFKTYGIYGFSEDSVNDEIYKRALEANGYTYGEDIVTDGYAVLNTERLKIAISQFYSFRSSAVVFDMFGDMIEEITAAVDSSGFLSGLSEYASSDAAGYFGEILDNADEIREILEKIEEVSGIDNVADKISDVEDFLDLARELGDADLDFGDDFDPTDAGAGIYILNGLDEYSEGFSDVVSDTVYHLYAAHYAAYNFDCCIDRFYPDGLSTEGEEDSSVNGVPFSDIHSEQMFDSEYILTGLSGYASTAVIGFLIFRVCVLSELTEILADTGEMEKINGAAEVLSAAVAAISCGTVDIPAQLMTWIVISILSMSRGGVDVYTVLSGGSTSLFEVLPDPLGGILNYDYRDFLYAFMVYIPDDILNERMLSVLNRDYGDIYCGLSITVEYGGSDFYVQNEYELYS